MANVDAGDGVRAAGFTELGLQTPTKEDPFVAATSADYLAELARKFGPRVDELLARRQVRQTEIDGGLKPASQCERDEERKPDHGVGIISFSFFHPVR